MRVRHNGERAKLEGWEPAEFEEPSPKRTAMLIRLLYLNGRPLTENPRWKAWKPPPAPLPIDDEITRLMERGRPPRLRPREDLELLVKGSSDPSCPFVIARQLIFFAWQIASREADREEERRNAASRVAECRRDLKNVQACLSAFADAHRGLLSAAPFTRYPMSGAPAPESYRKLIRRLEQLQQESISTLEHLRTEHRSISAHQGDVWKVPFAGHLGIGWRLLTGLDPTLTEQFYNFCASAYESLGDDMPEQAWERSARTAHARYSGNWSLYDGLLDN